MFGICRHVLGSELPAPANGAAYTPRSVLHLTRGKRYPIAGVGVFQAVTGILVRDDTGKPNWLPIAAFEIPPQPLPETWLFSADPGDPGPGWAARMGYPELVRDLAHIEALIERDPAALAIFDAALERSAEAG